MFFENEIKAKTQKENPKKGGIFFNYSKGKNTIFSLQKMQFFLEKVKREKFKTLKIKAKNGKFLPIISAKPYFLPQKKFHRKTHAFSPSAL